MKNPLNAVSTKREETTSASVLAIDLKPTFARPAQTEADVVFF
jgi:hypothetical protein